MSGSENSTAASATRIRQPPEIFGQRPVLRRLVEAEAVEDPRGARRRGMGVDVDEPRLDLCDALGIGRVFGLCEQRRALGVGGEDEVDQGVRRRPAPPARRCRAAPPSGW